MKIYCNHFFLLLSIMTLYSSGAHGAVFNVDQNANTVYLRKVCTEGKSPTISAVNNCFDTSADLVSWIATRQPTVETPLSVEISAGSFQGLTLICDNWGHTAFSGSGRGSTVLSASRFDNCNGLVFKHLTIKDMTAIQAVKWNNNTSSTKDSNWVDVELIGKTYAWYEGFNTSCADGISSNSGKHYWQNSRLMATGGFASTTYRDACGSENWFIGSEIIADDSTAMPFNVSMAAISQDGYGETHVYGSVIRVLASKSYSGGMQVWCGAGVPEVLAACTVNGGQIHIHGTGIDVISIEPNNIGALAIGPTSNDTTLIHANETSYVLKNGNGTTTRLKKVSGGNIAAAYLWQPGIAPPNIISTEGSDQAVVNTSGGTPRFVIYSNACMSKWFEVNANSCYTP